MLYYVHLAWWSLFLFSARLSSIFRVFQSFSLSYFKGVALGLSVFFSLQPINVNYKVYYGPGHTFLFSTVPLSHRCCSLLQVSSEGQLPACHQCCISGAQQLPEGQKDADALSKLWNNFKMYNIQTKIKFLYYDLHYDSHLVSICLHYCKCGTTFAVIEGNVFHSTAQITHHWSNGVFLPFTAKTTFA